MVKVRNTQTDMEWLWEKDKFVNRVYLMRELYEKYLEGSLEPSIFDTEADPFVDPNEPMHVGYSSVFLKSLSFCVPSEDDYAIYHDSQQTGIMHVKVEPCKPDGGVINDEDVAGSLVTAARPVRTASPLRHVVTTGGGPSRSAVRGSARCP